MFIAGYAGWPDYDTFFIVSFSGQPVYDPNPLRSNPNPKKPVSGSCRVHGLGQTLTPLLEAIRDGNLDPTCGYPARLDPNGPDFTRPDKE